MLTSGSVEGEYVVIELDDFDKVGLVADLYYYEDTNGDTESISVRKDLMNCYDVRLVQQEDILAAEEEAVVPGDADNEIKIEQDKIDHEV